VLGQDGNLWFEQGPWGNVPPSRHQVDALVADFFPISATEAVVLGTDGNLWLAQGPWGTVPPSRQQIDGNAASFFVFEPAAGQSVVQAYVLGTDGNLWLAQGPWATVPPKRAQIDGNMLAFQPIGGDDCYILGQDRNLWLAHGRWGTVPPNKHFDLQISDDSLTFTRKDDQIAAEAALDGIYVLRTSLPEQRLGRDDVVGRYKDLADVERFFRTLNTELDVRPIRHRLADRVRAHMFLRMLSYYISWHMKQALAPILFADNDKPAAAAKRPNPVAAAQRSDEALTKAARKRTHDDYPVHSFTSLLADLATICANQVQPTDDLPAFTKITTPTPLQRQAFELLDLSHRHGLA